MKRVLSLLVLFACLCLPVRAADTLRVACIGDSITYGMTLGDRENDCYPAQLQRLLGDGYRVANFGKSGATLLRKGHRPYMEQEEFHAAMQWPADIIVIHLGVNDTDPRNWPNYRDEFVDDYLALIDALKTVSPDARVLVALLSPIGDRHRRFTSGTKEWHDEIQDAIRTVAALSGAQLIDFHRPLYPYPQYLPDALHPNVTGSGVLARTVYQGITGRFGGLRLSPLYTDGMVLQRGVPLDLHGIADAGEEVTLRLGRDVRKVRAGTDGKWCVNIGPLEAARGLVLEVKTRSKELVFKDVAVGEVWLCSGQSNMEWLLRNSRGAAEALAAADDPDLHLFDMKVRWRTDHVAWSASVLDSVGRLDYFRETVWKAATRETVGEFSAVAYWFGKMLRDSLQVPVGLICNAVGGSPAEAWVDRHTLETQFPKILEDWLGNDFVQDWVRGRAAKNLENRMDGFDRHPYQPAYLFEAGVLPLDRYPVKGVIWYQGESNAHNMSAHERLFGLLVDSWRTYWGQPAMPFHYVQLSSLNRPSWPWFRDSQRRLLDAREGLGMAVSSDVGDSLDVHPRDKRPVGERLARRALHHDYGHAALVPSGPLVRAAVADGNRVIVSFDWAGGLHFARPQEERSHFEVAEWDGRFYPARAEIVGETVVLTCPEVAHPKLVRYAWEPYTRAHLYNGAGLPASTFRIAVQ